MSGAVLSPLGRLGLVVRDDGGLVFALAAGGFLRSAGSLLIRRREILPVGHAFDCGQEPALDPGPCHRPGMP
jgi:hypothetical protein